MVQDPNFHISVSSGWAKLGNIFHVRICPLHYLSHDRSLNLAAFMWLSPILIILLFENNIFLFVSDFQSISKINLSSMIVLMKCNCNNTRGYQLWLAVSIYWEKAQITINLGKMSCHFTTNGKCERLLGTQYWCYKDQIWSETATQSTLSIDIYILLVQVLFELLGHDESSEVTPTPKIAEFRKWWHFFKYIKKTNRNLALSNGTHFGTIFIHFNSNFSMIYLSFLYIHMLFIRQYHIRWFKDQLAYNDGSHTD